MDLQQLLGIAQNFPSLIVVVGGVALIGLIFYGALESIQDKQKSEEQKENDVFFFAIIAAIMVLGLMMVTIVVNK
jgi:hypothetical protein